VGPRYQHVLDQRHVNELGGIFLRRKSKSRPALGLCRFLIGLKKIELSCARAAIRALLLAWGRGGGMKAASQKSKKRPKDPVPNFYTHKTQNWGNYIRGRVPSTPNREESFNWGNPRS